MNRTNQSAYWQLNLFVLLMIGLMVLAMLADLSPAWMTVVNIAWAVLTVVGMGVWVHINWVTLLHEEQEQRAALVVSRQATGDMAAPSPAVAGEEDWEDDGRPAPTTLVYSYPRARKR